MTGSEQSSRGHPAGELVGTLEVRRVAEGSKSEMDAVVLVLDDPDALPVVLRRRDPVALDAEPELAVHAGARVRVTGSPGWSTFAVDSVEVIEAPPAS